MNLLWLLFLKSVQRTPKMHLSQKTGRAARPSLACQRTAVMECFNNNGLYKRKGCWWGAPDGRHISGVTVADLARDGLISMYTDRQHASARLTERGEWVARTLIEAANDAQVRE